mgnify:CR=1 FL=1
MLALRPAPHRKKPQAVLEVRILCEPLRDPMRGIAVEVYYVWMNPDPPGEIRRSGQRGTRPGFHVSDRRGETRRLLTDRGFMGEGVIDTRGIRGWRQDAGYAGFNDVEIFSSHPGATDQELYLGHLIAADRVHASRRFHAHGGRQPHADRARRLQQ